jgi:hypothetical protein
MSSLAHQTASADREGPPEKKHRAEAQPSHKPEALPPPLELASRQGFGTRGNKLWLLANYYKVQLPKGSLVEYEVS